MRAQFKIKNKTTPESVGLSNSPPWIDVDRAFHAEPGLQWCEPVAFSIHRQLKMIESKEGNSQLIIAGIILDPWVNKGATKALCFILPCSIGLAMMVDK